MSFLTLDGLPVPVREGSVQEATVVIGSAKRASNGSQRISVVTRKKEWRCATAPMTPSALSLLECVIDGRGDFADMDTDADTQKAIAGNSAEIIPSTAADGASIQNNVKSGSGALEQIDPVGGNNNNYLAADERLCQNAASPSTTGTSAVVTDDASNYFQGTTGLKIVTSALSGGVYFVSASVAAGDSVRGSAWVKGVGSVRALVSAGVLSAYGDVVVLSPTQWRRVDSPVLAPAITTAAQLLIVEAGISPAVTFYCGRAAVSHVNLGAATSWADGAYAHDPAFYDSASLFSGQDAAISMWFRCYASSSTAERYLVAWSATKSVSVTGGKLVFSHPSGDITSTADVDDGEWHNATAVWRSTQSSQGYMREVWLDGALVGGDALDPGDLSAVGNLYIGNYMGFYQLGGAIESVLFFEGSAPAGFGVAAFAMPPLSLTAGGFVSAAGDLIGQIPVTCYARVGSSGVIGGVKNSEWQSALRVASLNVSEK